MVIIDSSAWIHFINQPASPEGRAVRALVERGEAVMVGIVLSELLQGAQSQRDAEELKYVFNGLPYIECQQTTWIRAAELSREMRQKGQAVALTDLLIAALALEHGHLVYTLDVDFQRIPEITLHKRVK